MEEKYLEFTKKISVFGEYAEPYAANLEELVRQFREDCVHLEDENRNLSIAVVGQVKAGKSSFLNAVLFNGEGVLPKAATPMTAALTIIKYSEQVRAEVEFYSEEDWQAIGKANEGYNRILRETEERLRQENKDGKSGFLGREFKENELTPQIIMANADIPEELKAANELVQMALARGLDTENNLGKKIEIAGLKNINDLMYKLEDYVGAEGKYTPIVKSSIIYYNEPAIKDIEIIDTPGINDPVVSRGKRTKDYLGRCDVVFMLSRCGQFIDAVDLQILAQNLPSKGIKDIVLIGSQLDLEMAGEADKYKNITELLDNLDYTLENHAQKTLKNIELQCQKESEREIVSKLLELLPPIFISAMAFNIARHFDNLSVEEQHFLNQYNNMYKDCLFNREMLYELSNVDPVKEILHQQKERKTEILRSRVVEREEGLKRAFSQELEALRKQVERNREKLQREDIFSLQEQEKETRRMISQGKGKLNSAFQNAIVKIEKDFALLKTDIKDISREYSQLEEQTKTETEQYTQRTSRKFLVWKLPSFLDKVEEKTRTISYRYAQVYDAIEKIETFAITAEKMIKEKMLEAIDLPRLKSEIKNASLALFDMSDDSFDIDDILIPVERTVNKITIPEVDLGENNYGEEIAKKFSGSDVRDSDVDRLRSLQRNIVRDIVQNIEKIVKQKMQDIVSDLEATQNDFAENLLADISDNLDKLKKGLENKEETLKQFDKLAQTLKDIEKEAI